jgi:ADP-ribose pyrophosphatase
MSGDTKNRQVEWIGRESLMKGFFTIDKVRFRHGMFNGDMSPELYWYLLKRPDAVCAVVVNPEREVLYFVRQFRLAIAEKGDDPWSVELAAGVVDGNESQEEAIIREVREELGFEVEKVQFVQKIYPSPAFLTERIFLYYIEVSDAQRISAGGGTQHEHEDLEILEVPFGQIKSFLESHAVIDSKTLYGLAWFFTVKGQVQTDT